MIGHTILFYLAVIIIIYSLYKYYKPSIDIVSEAKAYKVLLWYNTYGKNRYINRKFVFLFKI